MSNSKNAECGISGSGWVHPDSTWLFEVKGFPPCGDGWKIAGTLSFHARYLDIQNDKVKKLFGKLNYHLNGEHNWHNVPVFWRWEYSDNERLHCHFVLMDATPEFHWLRGAENSFDSAINLVKWLKKEWKHGVSHYTSYRDEGWLEYILKPGTIQNTCYSAPIHFLKRKVRDRQFSAGLDCLMKKKEVA